VLNAPALLRALLESCEFSVITPENIVITNEKFFANMRGNARNLTFPA
jgi:hypothetical protein